MKKEGKLITNNIKEVTDYLMRHLDEEQLDDMDFEDMELAVDQVVQGIGNDLLQKLVKKKAIIQNPKI